MYCDILGKKSKHKANVLLDEVLFLNLIITTSVWNFLTLQDPEPALSQFPVTHYNLSCTSGEGDSCNETLRIPADTTSFELPVVAGVSYTITVSALSSGRESENNPQLNFGMFSACT